MLVLFFISTNLFFEYNDLGEINLNQNYFNTDLYQLKFYLKITDCE